MEFTWFGGLSKKRADLGSLRKVPVNSLRNSLISWMLCLSVSAMLMLRGIANLRRELLK